MSNQTILESIDPEIVDTLVSRRDAIKKGASVSALTAASLAAGSIPLALGALASEAYGQQGGPPADVVTVLKFALLLENLEAEFYKTVLGMGTGFSATNNPQAAAFTVRTQFTTAETAAINLIRIHEEAHVALLRSTLGTLGFTAPTFTGADFDFTGGVGTTPGAGPFAAATTNKAFLLVATQGFEDTGVRAYKGQAGNLMSNDAVLETALRIHSVEARHAAKIRRLRRQTTTSNTVVRYSGTIRGGGSGAAGATDVGTPSAAVLAALNAIYAGEDNTTHGTLNATTITGAVTSGGVPSGDVTNALTEAFDEPLTRTQVVSIVTPFVINARGLV